jgi:hypothetical protein
LAGDDGKLADAYTLSEVYMKVFAAVMVSAAWAQEEAALLADTRKTALPVLPKVVQAMQTAVSEQGPVGAIPVCKEKAPQLLQDMRRQTGWNIRRVSLKTRNPATGTPDAWETRLAGFNIAGRQWRQARAARGWRGVHRP